MNPLIRRTRHNDPEISMSSPDQHNPFLRKLAVVTALTSLLPIGLGSLVTTLGAGMAFPDWPTSDGQGMLTYPWHLSVGDKFVEHGHRLAGMLIGLCSLVLFLTAWLTSTGKAVRIACTLILAAVVIQGLIGAARVLLDERVMAYVHSVFGCLVFVGLWIVVLMTGKPAAVAQGAQTADRDGSYDRGLGRALVVVFPVIAIAQYSIGGVVRHFGTWIVLHFAGAAAVCLTVFAVVATCRDKASEAVRFSTLVAVTAVVTQIAIGLLTWATKFGIPETGLVAVQNSIPQIVVRSLHTVAGMVVVASAVAWSLRVRGGVGTRTLPSGQVAVQ